MGLTAVVRAQTAAQGVREAFLRIHREQMAGLPLLNDALEVETLDFQDWQGRVLGLVISPWMMSLVLLPGPDEDWASLALGQPAEHAFPAGRYRFLANRIDGIGPCQTHSIYSPMGEFRTQAEARAAAQDFLQRLMTPADPAASEGPEIDTSLLGRILRGEAGPDPDPQNPGADGAV